MVNVLLYQRCAAQINLCRKKGSVFLKGVSCLHGNVSMLQLPADGHLPTPFLANPLIKSTYQIHLHIKSIYQIHLSNPFIKFIHQIHLSNSFIKSIYQIQQDPGTRCLLSSNNIVRNK